MFVTGAAATAPGKIVVCGEYVVLDGAPAVAVAVDCRARVIARVCDGAYHTVRCPGLFEEERSFRVRDDGVFDWQPPAGDAPNLPLLERAWQATGAATLPALSLTLDTSAFADSERQCKLGLGSSAALTVALTAVLAKLGGQSVHLDELIGLHRDFQGGRGSGIDVAAAFHGGIVGYRMGKHAEVRQHPWPENLCYAILWSGRAAPTTTMIDRYAASTAAHDSRRRLADASRRIVDAWPGGAEERLLTLFADYAERLAGFASDHGIGIFDAGHADLARMAAGHRVVYKPCGAGGGDVGIVLATGERQIDNFVAAAAASGFRRLPLRVDDAGLVFCGRPS